MKNLMQHLRRRAAVLALGFALAAPQVWAAGTLSGTTISNNAQLSYQVGGTAQNVQSNTAAFTVDTVVRLTVQESNSLPTFVTLGGTAQVLQFTVTNTGNATQDYKLTPTQVTGGTITLGTTYTDTFDGLGCIAYVESGSAGSGWDAGTDTVTSIQNLGPDQSKTVYVVCNIPASGPANLAAAIVALTAETANAGTCATNCVLTEETTTANTAGVDIVFGDVATTYGVARDGKDTDRDAYVIQATLTISKTVTLLCDPFNGNNNPKNVPGAYVQYAITVSNTSSSTDATLTTVSDTLPIGPPPSGTTPYLEFDPDLRTSASSCATPESLAGRGFRLNCSGGSRACTTPTAPALGQYFTGVSDPDAVTVSGQSVSINGATLLPAEGAYGAGVLKAGESLTIRFNAVIK